MLKLDTCSDVSFLDDRHATPNARSDEFELCLRAEPQVTLRLSPPVDTRTYTRKLGRLRACRIGSERADIPEVCNAQSFADAT
jgi:hypothetical protein